METIFDVGANVGGSASHYLDVYSPSRLYCFEPVTQTFERLDERFEDDDRVQCFPCGFSSDPGTGTMVLEGDSDQYRLLGGGDRKPSGQTERVEVETIDRFCEQEAVKSVDLLKVDTEGHDLSVLRGAERMLSERRLKLVQTEVAMSPLNELHVPLEQVKEFMESKSYYLFGLYEQVGEWPLGSPVLRRTNAVFLAPDVDRQARA